VEFFVLHAPGFTNMAFVRDAVQIHFMTPVKSTTVVFVLVGWNFVLNATFFPVSALKLSVTITPMKNLRTIAT
jgi:hypothetical protein